MVRLKQVLVGLAGLVVVSAMLGLGLWQMQVFQGKEASSALDRAAAPAVSLVELVAPNGSVGDVFGRTVYADGQWADEELLVQDADGVVRVLTAFELADGRVLPVVRGALEASASSAPQAPDSQTRVVGVFLPSEAGEDHTVSIGRLSSVRLPLVAQLWPQQLTPGFLTLADAEVTPGLSPARLELPSGEGSVQNAGYALQWWVFAGFAGFMTVRFVSLIGRRGRLGTLSSQEAP